MVTDLIELGLSLNGQPLIRLTEYTIQSAEFTTNKACGYRQQTKDIFLRLSFENANVLLNSAPPSDEGEEDAEPKPDELDSVRNLLAYSVSSHGNQIAYLDGEVKIGNELGTVAEFSYKDLFVLSCSEEYAEATRNTLINIHMREKAR